VVRETLGGLGDGEAGAGGGPLPASVERQ
jgi:hypothetical protein